MKKIAKKSIKKTFYFYLIPLIFLFGILTAISIVWAARNLLFFIYEDTTKYYLRMIGEQVDNFEKDYMKLQKLIVFDSKDTLQKHNFIIKIQNKIISNFEGDKTEIISKGLDLLKNSNLKIKLKGIGPKIELIASLKTKKGNIIILTENAKIIANKYLISFITIFLIVILNLTAMAYLLSSTVFFPVINKLNKIKNHLQKYKSDKQIRMIEDKKSYEEFNLIYEEFNRMAVHIEQVEKELIETKDNEITILAGIAHDINTPITVLRGTAENLISYGNIDEKSKKNIMKILDQAIYIQMLVDDMLTLAKADLAEIPINYQLINLDNLFDRITDAFELIAINKNITILADANNIKLYADELRLTQILNNLIRNAIVHAKGADIVEITAEENDDNVIIRIKDNGCGIDDSEVNKVFNRFYSKGSSGLGLYVVKILMEKHGGKCIYNRNNGSEFNLIFTKRRNDYE
jgi:signal transduction histidine kinase